MHVGLILRACGFLCVSWFSCVCDDGHTYVRTYENKSVLEWAAQGVLQQFKSICLFAYEDVHQSMHHTDSTSQSALHHACSHCLWSRRICKATLELARDCPCELLNIGSTGYGRGLTPLLHVVNGAGVHSDALCRIAEVLINRHANIEACGQQGNTPFLLASAAGFTDMLKLLRARNANIRHVNTRGGGARALAAMSSGTTQLA